MDYFAKHEGGRAYQIYNSVDGLCLSTTKRYNAIVVFGYVTSFCEEGGKLDYKSLVGYAENELHYKLLLWLNCWDLLYLLENGYNSDDELEYVIFGD